MPLKPLRLERRSSYLDSIALLVMDLMVEQKQQKQSSITRAISLTPSGRTT